ncbi:pyridoxal phosphate-dependent transferase [Fomitopsis serialis]|uniref:pyridoxal phosphate-dependent transferase n=1 Tax=Fomitopsis serialis TaxID=139415 RepID=UPI002007F99B|nr:pyridoxal phosphate-dependent transferase [Neoantrodia serialis]KAH9934339.1 pyridoxal phosphate-dependent transferase [Neoantrodia serialis]
MATFLQDALPASPVAFGRAARSLFQLDPEYTNLNHGTAGAVPRYVEDASRELDAEMSLNPDRFIWFEYRPRLEKVRAQMATLIGAQQHECVFVPNVSHGINTVLRNFEWGESDTLLITDCHFKTVTSAAQFVRDNTHNLMLSEFKLSFPERRSVILGRFKAHIRAIKRAQALHSGVTPRSTPKIVAVFDSISAAPAVLMPWKEMVQICKDECVWSVVDAAHSLGQEVDLDLGRVSPDFWVSSCSKWLYTKLGCAVLYVPERNHRIIKSAFPTSLTYHGLGQSPVEHDLQFKFHWTGTLDFTPVLSIKSALEIRSLLGGEAKINQYCHDLAMAGGRRLAEIMKTHMLYPADDEEAEAFTANMVNVAIPLPGSLRPSEQITLMFQDKLLNKHNVYAMQFYHNGQWWTRVSAQIYNELKDFDILGHALLAVCAEMAKSLSPT